MRYRLEQHYAASPDTVSRAFADPALYSEMAGLPKFGKPEVLSRTEDGDTVRLAVRYRFTGNLSGAARRALDPAKLTWVEHSTHDMAGGTVEFSLAPDHYADRFRAAGRYAFLPHGEGTLRVIDGEVVVKAPLVAGTVERAIVSGLREHLAAEAPVVEEFLAGR
jgi:hypothetical protein